MDTIFAAAATVELLLVAAVVSSTPRLRASLVGQATETTCLVSAAFSAWFVLVRVVLGA